MRGLAGRQRLFGIWAPLLLAGALLLDGCSLFHRKKPQRAGVAPQPFPVGAISLVNESGRFVLIDSGNFPSPPVGGMLKSYTGADESAELVTTQVKRHPFAIADIKSGEPHKGDRVLLQPPVSATPVPTATPLPAHP